MTKVRPTAVSGPDQSTAYSAASIASSKPWRNAISLAVSAAEREDIATEVGRPGPDLGKMPRL